MPFGWATGYAVEGRTSVSIAYELKWTRWEMLGGALVIWALVVWRWRRTRVRREPTSRAAATATRERRERRERHDSLADVDDESSGGSGCDGHEPTADVAP